MTAPEERWCRLDRIFGQPLDLIAGHPPTELSGHDVFNRQDASSVAKAG
jgi:hypothetical protein